MNDDINRQQVVRILRATRRIIRAVDLFGRQTQANFGVSGPQLTCLTVLYEEGSMPIQELGRHVFLSSGTLTGIIDRLERKMYLRRVRSQEDRRKIFLELTEAGSALVEQAPHPLQLRMMAGLARNSHEENQALCDQLEKYVEMLEASGVGAEPVLDINFDANPEPLDTAVLGPDLPGLDGSSPPPAPRGDAS